jgi:hypothetical protein
MDNDRAKLILQAYRANGEDTSDPFFSKALEQARLDPALRNWLIDQQAFDARMGRALQAITPPLDLREIIVLTHKVVPFPRWASRHKLLYGALLAAAACVAILLTATSVIHTGMARDKDHALSFATLTEQVLELKRHDQISLGEMSSDPSKLRGWLAERGAPSDFKIPPGLRGIPSLGCQSYVINGVNVSLVCFTLGPDRIVHLFITNMDDLEGAPNDAAPRLNTNDGVPFITWSAGGKSYVLTSDNVNENILIGLMGAA